MIRPRGMSWPGDYPAPSSAYSLVMDLTGQRGDKRRKGLADDVVKRVWGITVYLRLLAFLMEATGWP